jgi:hypothetical protein
VRVTAADRGDPGTITMLLVLGNSDDRKTAVQVNPGKRRRGNEGGILKPGRAFMRSRTG